MSARGEPHSGDPHSGDPHSGEPPRTHFKGRTHRLINSRYPTVGVFDDIAGDEGDLRAAFELEDLTNDRQVATARLQAIPGGEIPMGEYGASMVMAAFLHADPRGGRFSDYRLGAWYAATEIETAIEETVFHHERRLRASAGGFPNRIQMRELLADIDAEVIDLRGEAVGRPELFDLDDYTASQAFAAGRRWPFRQPGEAGLVYGSVRRAGGANVCVFKPAAVGLPLRQGEHFEYVWTAKGELSVMKLTNVAR